MFMIDNLSRQPIYEQIMDQLERFILIGAVKPGEQLPSVRGLSVEPLVNPNTIQKAYAELDRRGVIQSVPGKGCFVSENALERLAKHKEKDLEKMEEQARQMALAGIPEDMVLSAIQKAYRQIEEERHD